MEASTQGAIVATQDAHYSAHDIEQRILAALRAAGLDPERRLSPMELAALDHFHTGGVRASLVLKALARIGAEDRVLDIGAGLAGPARMLAASPGCRVDCIELSSDYCVAAALLNRITGLQDRIGVHEGSALAMPFADASFDVGWMQNVGMNIADKRGLYREVRRVLKPGGRFAFQEMVAGNGEAIHFPLPWATDPADNQLVCAPAMRELLVDSGFAEAYFEDVSDAPLPPPEPGTPDSAPQAPLSLSVYVDNLAQKAENATRSVREGRIRLYRGVFRAVG
ncbi:MAG TPA: class I SAM-dependent methyltransferase [Burkholderiaceae bacterium]|nr:class I SAM-dependent methyltransferase [Burkholderiaceae bacterium]